MERDIVRRRNTAFNFIYRRVTFFYPRFVPPVMRWLMEIMLLLLAISTLSLWGFVHVTYVVDPEDCLTDIEERPFIHDVILQVEVYSNTTELHYLRKKYSSQAVKGGINTTEEKEGNSGVYHQNITEPRDVNGAEGEPNTAEEELSLYETLDINTLQLYSVDYTILEFSQEPGYLSLSQSARAHLNISTRHLYINPENTTCFGGKFGRFITKYMLGYEIMIIASFKNLLPAIQGSGYVKNLLTGSHYYYHVQWMGKWRYIAGLLPTFFFTLVASVLLRQIHYHGFKFMTHFHRLLNEGIPMPIQTGAQVPFLIITYAAIGLVIVMSEALGDDSMYSLFMISTVWEADQFYAVFCRHKISKAYFPMFFFLYHSVPYAYFLRFNGQFWFLPFLFHWLLVQNAILFFLHHFEISGHNNQAIGILLEPANLQQQQRIQPEELHPQNEEEGVDRTGARTQEEDSQRASSHGYLSPVEESRTSVEARSAVFINVPIQREGHTPAVHMVDGRNDTQSLTDHDRQTIRERRLRHLEREENF